MNKAKKLAALGILLSLTLSQPFLALADTPVSSDTQGTETQSESIVVGPGQNLGNSTVEESAQSGNTVSDGSFEHTELNVDSIRPFMTTPHDADVAEDPVLNLVPLATYYIYNSAGDRIDYGYTQDNQSFTFSPEGFKRILMEHQNVGRWYYRTYTTEGAWGPWAASGETTPDRGTVTAIMVRVKGYTHKFGEVYYRAVLNDGTVTDWAKSGEACGSIGSGKYIVGLKITLWNNNTAFSRRRGRALDNAYEEGIYFEENEAKYRLASGEAYTGFAFDSDSNQYYFENGVAQKGWKRVDGYKLYFNEQGILQKDLEPIMGRPGSYVIRINKATRTLYVMAKDESGNFTIPYKTLMCSTGTETPLGSFKIYEKYRWHFMHKDCYTQFLSRFYKGFIIHSLLYERADARSFDAINYNFMDQAISGGCIRLKAIDSAWVYENCKNGTPVIIYSDAWDKGPVEKDAIMQAIPREQNYDPTDATVVGQQSAEDAAKEASAKKEAAKEAANNLIEPNA